MKKYILRAFAWAILVASAFNSHAQIGVTKYGTNALLVNGPTGDYNTGLGYFVLAANTSGNRNTGAGANALRFNTVGVYNTATGAAALYQNTSGGYNTGFGAYALFTNTTGYRNTAVGSEALRLNTDGILNTAYGDRAMYNTTTGDYNTSLGATSLFNNTTGSNNTASGNEVLYTNTWGYSNTASGYRSMYYNTSGAYNVAGGYYSLHRNTTGMSNTAFGSGALSANTTGSNSVAIGASSLTNSTNGFSNIAIGHFAGETNTTGDWNVLVGTSADVISSNLTNATAIGKGAIVTGSNRVRIGNNAIVSIGGQVGWTTFSDGRYKKDVKEDVPGLAFINSLRPVSYTVNVKGLNEFYRKGTKSVKEGGPSGMEQSEDAAGKIIHNGFLAQEVEMAAKELKFEFSGVDVPETKDGLYGLRYDNFISPIVKSVQELSVKNDKKDSVISNLENLIGSLQDQINDLKLLITKTGGGLPNVFSTGHLKQNAPNPFINNTVISYYVPENSGHAQLKIMDVSGRVIKTINAAKGEGKIIIRSGELAAGNYSYTLYVDNKMAETRQMLLLK